VPEVDVAGGFIRVDPAAAGLIEDAEEDGINTRPRGPKQAGGNR
jgi:16S rRNA processing protein RimM